MPTLLNVNNYHYRRGGADVMYLEQTALFRDLGWSTVEFAMRHPENLASEWEDYFVDEIELGRDYSLADRAMHATRVVYSRQAQRRLRSLLDDTRPDVAHLHNIYHHLSPAILPVLGRAGIPVVLTTHDLKLACPAYRMVRDDAICERCKGGRIHNVVRYRCIKGSAVLSSVVFVETAVHRILGSFRKHVDRFVVPSRFYGTKLAEWGLDPAQLTYIPNYVRPERFQPGSEAGSGVVYFGRLAPEKGLGTLVRAAARADVPLRIAGTGPEEPSLRTLAADVGADVEFLGHLEPTELHDVVRSARATVLPSEWYENAPVSVLESYALGTIVVGARIGGIDELIREGETGFGFTSGDVDELVASLRRVIELADQHVVEMGRAARRWVDDEYTADHYRDRLLNVYRELGVPC